MANLLLLLSSYSSPSSYSYSSSSSSSSSFVRNSIYASDDCIIPVVNAVSRGEFDEFTTRFYEGTKRMDGRFATNSPSSRSAILDLCPTLPLPTDLHPDIYYSQYYRARLYCVSRKASNGQVCHPAYTGLPRPFFFSSLSPLPRSRFPLDNRDRLFDHRPSLPLPLSLCFQTLVSFIISSRRRRLLLVPLFLSFPFFLSRIRYHEKAALGRPRERKKEKRKLLEAVSGKKFLGIVARVPRKRRGGGGQCEIIVLLGRVSLN